MDRFSSHCGIWSWFWIGFLECLIGLLGLYVLGLVEGFLVICSYWVITVGFLGDLQLGNKYISLLTILINFCGLKLNELFLTSLNTHSPMQFILMLLWNPVAGVCTFTD